MTSYNAQLVGVNFRDQRAKETVKALEVGNILQLEREPDNPYDPNAIRVVVPDHDENDNFLGFIERGMAAILAPEMDDGSKFTATVNTRLSPLSVLLYIEPAE